MPNETYDLDDEIAKYGGQAGTADGGPADGAEPNQERVTRASGILACGGVRLMRMDEAIIVGLWSDLDSRGLRQALRLLGSGELPIRYLDGIGIPSRYKPRRIPGEPVPWEALLAMEQNPAEPWVVRNRMLREMGWPPVPWME